MEQHAFLRMTAKAIRKPALISLLSFSIALLVFSSGLLDTFELKAYDFMSASLNPKKISDDILIIAIDQRSVDALAKQDISWPWPRQVYAPMVEYLSEAEGVFIDILYTENSSYGVDDDRIFAEAVRKAGNVYLPVFLTDKKEGLSADEKKVAERIDLRAELPAFQTYSSMVTQLDIIGSAAAGLGNVMIRPDRDGTYRRVPLILRTGDHVIPHFVLPYLLKKGIAEINGSRLTYHGKSVPIHDNTVLLRYSSHPEAFRIISASDLIQAYLDSSSGRTPEIKKDFFRSRHVFIGMTAPGLYDLKPTAVASVSTGVHVHATALDNLINSDLMRPAGNIPVVLFMLIISVSVCSSVLRFHSISISLAVITAALVTAAALPAFLFMNTIYIKVLPPIFSAVLSFAAAAAYSYAIEGRQKRFIKKTFSQYMDRTIVDYLLKNPEMIHPGGRKMRVTVFFADIAGFTTLAEQLPPEESAKILNSIFNAFTEVIISNRGVIDKYIGDCVMAFWGAPLPTGEDEAAACSAAIQCMEALQELNRSFISKGLPEISMRIGMHTGDAIVGNLGSDRLFDFTVVGDTVNLASRLEAINKVFRTRIIASEETVASAGDAFLCRELGRIEVKGKTRPVTIYEVAGCKDTADDQTVWNFGIFSEALRLYRERNMEKAALAFAQLPNDGPAVFYARRCEAMPEAASLTEGWDIIKMTEK